MDFISIAISACLGIGLSASAGFRVFIPLLLLSIAGYMGWVPLNSDWSWAGSLTAIIVLAVAAIVEVGAYYIPVVDNFLDGIMIPLATIAGTAVVVAVVGDLDPVYTWALAIIAGGGTAATVATTTSAARLTSTATTGGIGNSLVSTAEVGFSSILAVLSLVWPFLAIIVVIILLLLVRKLYKTILKKA